MTVSLVNKDNVVAKPDVSLAITQNQKCKELLSQGYKLEATHEYTDKDGITIFYKVRLKNAVTKDKQFLSVYFHDSAWVWKEPVFTNGLKPLYNLQLIVSNPTAKIWVCEGELKADRLNEFFVKHNLQSNNIATTSGSSSSANKADWAAIATHKVVIWPDNDESGQKYLNDVAKNLTDLNCDVQVVDIEKLNLPCKGDVVDWLEAKSNTAFVDFESIMLVSVPSEIEPLFNIAEASVADFLLTQPLPRKYLLEQCLPIGKTGLLAGMGGVRKSHLMLELMISIATGKPLCGHWVIGTTGATLGLFAEEDKEELHRRLYFATEKLSKPDKAKIVERVFIKSMTGINNQLTYKSGPEAEFTETLARLIVTTKQIPDLKLIVIDPASRFRGGDENSSADTTRFVEACELLAKESGATVLIVHHVNKASMSATEASQAAARGSSALTDGVRWQMNMSVMSLDAAKKFGIPEENRKSYVCADVTKNNYAPPQKSPVWLELTKPHGILNYVELASAGDTKKVEIMSKIIEKIKVNASNGIEHSKSAFTNQYSGTTNIFKTGDKGLRSLIEQAILDGRLVLSPPKVPIKNVTEVLIVAHQEPYTNYSKEDLISQL